MWASSEDSSEDSRRVATDPGNVIRRKSRRTRETNKESTSSIATKRTTLLQNWQNGLNNNKLTWSRNMALAKRLGACSYKAVNGMRKKNCGGNQVCEPSIRRSSMELKAKTNEGCIVCGIGRVGREPEGCRKEGEMRWGAVVLWKEGRIVRARKAEHQFILARADRI